MFDKIGPGETVEDGRKIQKEIIDQYLVSIVLIVVDKIGVCPRGHQRAQGVMSFS